MYAQEDGPPRRPRRLLLVDMEDWLQNQIRQPWLLEELEELQGELEMDEEALGAVEHNLDGLAHSRGDGGALGENHQFLWR